MIRQEQCNKVCRILDDVLANRPTERDSLIVAVQKAFDAQEQPETNCSEIPNNSDTISRQAEQSACEYCHEDSDGYVLSIEKNGHAYIQNGKLALRANGWWGECAINFCPMCGRKLRGEQE